MKPVGFPLTASDARMFNPGNVLSVANKNFIVTKVEKNCLTVVRHSWYNVAYCWIERSLKSLGLIK